jgi:Membrane protein involved in the export of O-antigen and teichoic acid
MINKATIMIADKFEKLNLSSSIISALKNSGWLMFDKLVRLLLGLLVSAWVARYLGPEQYGELAYVLAYLAFFQAIAILGMDSIIVRDIAKDKTNASSILGTAFVLRLSVGILCWLVAILGMALTNGLDDRSVYITALSGAILVFQAADTVDLWFQSQSQSKRTVIAKLIAYSTSNGIKVILILSQANLLAFAAVMAFDTCASAIGLFYAYKKFPCKERWHASKQHALALLQESWPFIFSGLSIILYMRIDQILIKEWLGEKQLGIYAAVLPLSMLWSFVPTTLSISFAPYIARKKNEGEQAYWAALAMIFRLYAALGWLIAIPIAMCSPYIVSILFGEAYKLGATVLSIIIFTNVFINMGLAQSLWIVNERKSKISLYKTLLGAIVCLVANYVLIPQYGITGAAISAVLAQAASTVFANIFFSHKVLLTQLKSLILVK